MKIELFLCVVMKLFIFGGDGGDERTRFGSDDVMKFGITGF